MRHHRLASLVVVVVVVVVVTCAGCPKANDAPAAPAPSAPAPIASAPAPAGPHYVDDDFDGALRAAKEAGKVVFVDGWAPWCHTCLSMQRDVLRDPSLVAYQDRVVFAAIDTDRPEAASFVQRFPLRSWPTFFVIDPSAPGGAAALAEHGGSLSLVELRAFLDEALRARDPAAASEPQAKALLLGHAAMGKKDYATAAQRYREAAAVDGKRRPEALLAAMRALTGAKDDAGCVALGVQEAGKFRTSSSSADFISYLVTCAERLPQQDKRRGEALGVARKVLDDLTGAPPADASVDDRADALAILADVAELSGDAATKKSAHERRLALLEADAAAQKTVEDARVHDYARLNSYIALGRGDEAVALLVRRTQELPQSYEAWARLASAYHQLGRDDDALPAAQKAVDLSYGPRRLRYRTLIADLYAAKKDVPGERGAVQALLDDAKALPPGHRDDATIEAAAARLKKLGP